MKYIYKILLALIVIAGVNSCNNDDDIYYVVQQPAPTFTIEAPLGGTSIILDDTNVENTALTLIWEDTKNGSDESYTIQYAIAGTEFATPINAGTSDITNFSWTVLELNTIFLEQMRLQHSEESAIEVRILASNGEVSNTITLIVTPHVEAVSELYLNGSFTSWDPALGIAMDMGEFNIFKITHEFVDGDEFNFIESNTSDDPKWQLTEAGSSSLTKYGGVDVSGFVGKYDITVDLITNTITMVQILTPDELFLVGSLTGWDPATSLPFAKDGDIFTITIDLVDGDEFKFLPQNTGWDGDW